MTEDFEIEALQQQIKQERSLMEEAKRRISLLEVQLTKRQNAFEGCCLEANTITDELDRWVRHMPLASRRCEQKGPLSVLFLGACSGEWAARTRYRGVLPGFGGFLVLANGHSILVDPGRGTFSSLLSEEIHPTSLDAVIATHAHWDCVRDLGLIVMAATGRRVGVTDKLDSRLKLFADRSVLHGLPMDLNKFKDRDDSQQVQGRELDEAAMRQLEEQQHLFTALMPASLTPFDLYFRLRGRFAAIGIAESHSIFPGVDLHTRCSYHTVSYGAHHLPSLDIVVHRNGKPAARCVYLSDTEYRPTLAAQFDAPALGPIDILICNVKTLNVLPYPESTDLAGYTTRHLGWRGLVQLTKDLQDLDLLTGTSLVVMRAWGIETVTTQDPHDDILVAMPEKLQIYESQFVKTTGQPGMVPGTTWVDVPSRNRPEFVHVSAPFQVNEYRFGKISYRSEKMRSVVLQARGATDSREPVLILGESGAGKDELAKAIHNEACRSQKRNGAIHITSAPNIPIGLGPATLMGHSKGAFTSAICDEKGWFGQAENGTLVIEELGEMHSEHQTLFLTVLEERKYRRIGDNKEFPLTAQIIMTTDQDLWQAAECGRFSRQLLYRIKRQITIPPLRERLEDIPAIIEGWRRERLVAIGHMDATAIRALQRFRWPGNVRQLLNVMQMVAESGNWSVANIRAIAEADHAQSPQSPDGSPNGAPEEDSVDELRQAILDALADGVSLSRRELQQRTSCPVNSTMVSSLNGLVQSGRIKRSGRGPKTRYRLNGNGR